MVRLPVRFCRLGLLWLLVMQFPAAAAAGEAHVVAASSLRTVLPELLTVFTARSGHQVTVSYGSSGRFARQIERGAPYQLFLSADAAYIDRLHRAGLTADGGATYAAGRLALFASHRLGDASGVALEALPRLVAEGRLTHFAIAHPDHAPYGTAARAALTEAGVWDALVPRLVVGENAAQTVRFLQTGSAEAGLVPLPLVITGQLAAAGSYRPLEALRLPRIEHRMVLLGRSGDVGEAARALYDFLRSLPAQAILERYGFGRAVEG